MPMLELKWPIRVILQGTQYSVSHGPGASLQLKQGQRCIVSTASTSAVKARSPSLRQKLVGKCSHPLNLPMGVILLCILSILIQMLNRKEEGVSQVPLQLGMAQCLCSPTQDVGTSVYNFHMVFLNRKAGVLFFPLLKACVVIGYQHHSDHEVSFGVAGKIKDRKVSLLWII